MPKSNRHYSSGSGPARPDSRRRVSRTTAAPQPPQRPPAGGPVPAPRPLVPERRSAGRIGSLAMIGMHRIVFGAVVLVLIAVFGLLMYAWYDDAVRPRRELALRVGDRSYSMEYFAKRYRQAIEDPANAAQLRSGLLTTVPEQTLDRMEIDAILLQRADALGITVGQNEIDREMLVQNNIPVVTDTPEGAEVGPDDSFEVTPAMQNALRARLQESGYTLKQFREIAHANVLRDKAQNHFKELTPARAPQVRVRVLQFPSESDARIAIEKIQSGESTFTDLANTVSLDPVGRGRGGERDWLTRGILPPNVDEAAFSLPLNTLSEPIDSGVENGWVLIEVLERTEERDVSDTVRRQLADKRFTDWLNEQRQSLSIKRALTPDKIAWAFEWADPAIPSSPQQGPIPVQPSIAPGFTPDTPSSAPGSNESSPQSPPASTP